MSDYTQPRRKMRLPQLAKHHRRMRIHGPQSEFVTMCKHVAFHAQVLRERAERLRSEARAA